MTTPSTPIEEREAIVAWAREAAEYMRRHDRPTFKDRIATIYLAFFNPGRLASAALETVAAMIETGDHLPDAEPPAIPAPDPYELYRQSELNRLSPTHLQENET